MTSLILNNTTIDSKNYEINDDYINTDELVKAYIIKNINEITHENIVYLCKLYTKSSEHKIEYKTSKKRVSGLVSKNNGIIDVMNFDIIDKYIYFHIDLDVVKLTQFTVDNKRYYTKTIGNVTINMMFDEKNNLIHEYFSNDFELSKIKFKDLNYYVENNIECLFNYLVNNNNNLEIFDKNTKKEIVCLMLKNYDKFGSKITIKHNKQMDCYIIENFKNTEYPMIYIPSCNKEAIIHYLNDRYDKIPSYINICIGNSKCKIVLDYTVVLDIEYSNHCRRSLYDDSKVNKFTNENEKTEIKVNKFNENKDIIKAIFNLDVSSIKNVNTLCKTSSNDPEGNILWETKEIQEKDGIKWLINNEYINGKNIGTILTRIYEYNKIFTHSETIIIKNNSYENLFKYVKIENSDVKELMDTTRNDCRITCKYEKKDGIVNSINRKYHNNTLISEEIIVNNEVVMKTKNDDYAINIINDRRNEELMIMNSNKIKNSNKIMKIDLGNIIYEIKGIYEFNIKNILIYEYGTGSSKLSKSNAKKEEKTTKEEVEEKELKSIDNYNIENNHQVKQSSLRNGEMKVAYNPSIKMIGGTIGYKAAVTEDKDLVIVKLMIPKDAKIFWDDKYDKYRSNKAQVISIIPVSIVKTNDKSSLAIKEHITDNACPVCLTKMPINMLINPCKHHICSECAEDYFTEKKCINCPTCNKKFTDLQKYTIATFEDEKGTSETKASILEAYSFVYNNDFKYTLGETITIDKFKNKYNKSCGPGIHYHSNINDAIQWFEYLFVPIEVKIIEASDVKGIANGIEIKGSLTEQIKGTYTPTTISKLLV
jgi:hypothetical protein